MSDESESKECSVRDRGCSRGALSQGRLLRLAGATRLGRRGSSDWEVIRRDGIASGARRRLSRLIGKWIVVPGPGAAKERDRAAALSKDREDLTLGRSWG